MTFKRLTPLLMLLLCCGPFACGTEPGGGPDTKAVDDSEVIPDIIDALTDGSMDAEMMEATDVGQEKATLVVTPLYIIHKYEKVDDVTPPDTQCGMFYNGSSDLDTFVEIHVEASLTPTLEDAEGNDRDGSLGIDSLVLYEPDGESKLNSFTHEKEELPDGGDHYYWRANVQASSLTKLFKEDGEVVDGRVFLRVKATPKDSLKVDTKPLEQAIKVTLDQTWPTMKRNRPEPEFTKDNPILVQGFLTVDYDLEDFGNPPSGLGRFEVFIGDDMEPAKVIENPSQNVVSKIDMSGYDSGEYLIRVVATDCVGNREDDLFSAINVAQPDFKLPAQVKTPGSVGTLHTLHTIVATEPAADDALTPGSGVYDEPDILAIGTDGLAWAQGNVDGTLGPLQPLGIKCPEPPVEGEEEPPPEEEEGEEPEIPYVWDDMMIVDAYLDDVTGDGYFDIVALVQSQDSKQVVIVRKNANYVNEVSNNKPEEECPELHNWNGTECVYEYDVCYEVVEELPIDNKDGEVDGDANLLRLAHLDDDDLADGVGSPGDHLDILVASPNSDPTLWLFKHTGKSELEEVPPPDPDEEEPQEETPYFSPAVRVGGTVGVSDIAVGNFNNDPLPDVVMGLGDQPGVSVFLQQPEMNDVLAPKYTTLTGGTVLLESGTAKEAGGKFDPDTMDDIVVTATGEKAVYFVTSKGGGYFDNPASSGSEEHPWALSNVANMVHHMITNLPLTDEEVDAHAPTLDGIAMSFGGKPESMLFTDLSGTGNPDIAVAVPELNQIALFLGTGEGTFVDGLFVSPGKSPRSLAAADFNDDGHTDLVCLVDTEEDGAVPVLLMNEAVPYNSDGVFGKKGIAVARFHSPMEIPLPVGYHWTAGRLVPTHFIVEDFNGDKLQDVVVATAPDKQATPSGGEKSLPLIMSYMSKKFADSSIAPYPQVPAIKSAVALEFSQNLSGFAAGNLNGDFHLDLAITASKSADSLCAGRTFDVLIGGWMTTRAMDEKKEEEGEEPDPEPTMGGYSADYFVWEDTNPGHFTPMGGYLGLQAPTGIAVASLDEGGVGALYDDIILTGSEAGDGDQDSLLATYLTLNNDEWTNPDDSGLCLPEDRVWYDGSPYWPMEQTDIICQGGKPEDLPGLCDPQTGSCGPCTLSESFAYKASETGPNDIKGDPVAIVHADFFPDPMGCVDILVLQSAGLLTYLRGKCDLGVYDFPPDLPAEILTVGPGPVDMDAADLDDDGNFDAVVALSNEVVILYGQPGGESFGSPISLGINSEVVPSSVTLADVNDDGKEDILVTSTPFNRLAVFINANVEQGDHKYSYTSFPTGKEPIDSQVGDFNNDGCLDIAVLNSGAKSVTILESARCDEK